jgi:hypothetical protein
MLTDKSPRPTAMAVAFYQAAIANPASPVCKRIGRSIERNQGLVIERQVDARVSYRTAQKLKQQGVL